MEAMSRLETQDYVMEVVLVMGVIKEFLGLTTLYIKRLLMAFLELVDTIDRQHEREDEQLKQHLLFGVNQKRMFEVMFLQQFCRLLALFDYCYCTGNQILYLLVAIFYL
eukprot:TRINITY_DN4487_c0_g1_i6.p3 TRINITY_DN4487_c0_g1~~TRINITY_DN4487_c0_g1_i6.p3  ORF type:complete len:109 (+),score=11.55 TRINITY_DN4487_c0_g1_i6:159-485(+)